jgi:hypothetical protein
LKKTVTQDIFGAMLQASFGTSVLPGCTGSACQNYQAALSPFPVVQKLPNVFSE